MAILDVGVHIGGITDEVVNRMRPATGRMLEAARAGSSYVDRFLRFDGQHNVGRLATDVIVPRETTRC